MQLEMIGQAILKLIAAIALAFAAPAFANEQQRIGIVQPTEEFAVSPPIGIESRRFYLSVPENRNRPDSPAIELPVIVLKGAEGIAASPVVMLTGGPGTAGLSAARYPGAYPWVGARDFVVLGQRGTHYARPALMCAGFAKAPAKEKVKAVRACADSATAKGIDLSAYNTAESARDLEDLRRMLGAEKLTLYALSYGTRLALSYARQFPDRVEAMVLEAPLPFSADYDRELPANIEAVLKAIAQKCSKGDLCNERFPDLWNRFSASIAARSESDVPVGEPSAAQIALNIAPSNREDISKAIALMDAAARGDFSPFRTGDEGDGTSDFAWGMRLSVWCSERPPSSGKAEPFAGISAPTFTPEVCATWPVPPRPTDELEDPQGDYPTLILAGEYDVLTPPAWGKSIAARLDQARLITVPAGLHSLTTDWSGSGCAMAIAHAFIADPGKYLANASPDCITREVHPEFELDQKPIRPRTSLRLLGSSRKHPIIRLVSISTS